MIIKRTDAARALWVENHTGLNFDRQRKGMSTKVYVRIHREVIDKLIDIELAKGAADRDDRKA